MAGDEVALKEEKEVAISGKQKASVRRETSAVSGMRVMIVHQKPTPKTAPPSQPQKHEVEVRREKETSEAEASLGSPTEGACTTLLCDYWHPPECQFYV